MRTNDENTTYSVRWTEDRVTPVCQSNSSWLIILVQLAAAVLFAGLLIMVAGCSRPDTVDGLPPAKAEPVSMMTDFDDRPAWMLYLLYISPEPEFKRC